MVEDSVLAKLEWFRLTDETSQRQWDDVSRLVQLHSGSLDVGYLCTMAESIGVRDLLDRLLRENAPVTKPCNATRLSPFRRGAGCSERDQQPQDCFGVRHRPNCLGFRGRRHVAVVRPQPCLVQPPQGCRALLGQLARFDEFQIDRSLEAGMASESLSPHGEYRRRGMKARIVGP